MKVLVAGAHGKTARRLVRILTEDGHEVRGLVRKEEQMPDVEADDAEAVLVDLEEEEVEGRIGEAVEGCDAIVFAAGAGPGSGAARKETMDYGGAGNPGAARRRCSLTSSPRPAPTSGSKRAISTTRSFAPEASPKRRERAGSRPLRFLEGGVRSPARTSPVPSLKRSKCRTPIARPSRS